jgi:hypothetical protein
VKQLAPTLADFPGAPRGAYVCAEGWLIVGEEAWPLDEWLHPVCRRPRRGAPREARIGRPQKYATEAERLDARRRSSREHMRRRREAEWQARHPSLDTWQQVRRHPAATHDRDG